jgi:diaminopimelate decarboxylase
MLLDAETLEGVVRGVGSPFFLFRPSILHRQVDVLARLKGSRFAPYYMAKACFLPEVLRGVVDRGVGVVVTSELEFELAVASGAKGSDLALIGPSPQAGLVRRALEHRCGLIVVEGSDELHALGPSSARVGLRVTLPIHAHPRTSFVRMPPTLGKFGLAPSEVARAGQALVRRGLDVRALTTNLGSQICHPSIFEEGLRRLVSLACELRASGVLIERLGLGGGFPVPQLRKRRSLPLGRLREVLLGREGQSDHELAPSTCDPSVLVPRLLRQLEGSPFELFIEPGRWVVAESMDLVTRVIRVEQRRGLSWLYVDGGIDMLPEAGFGEVRPIRAIGRSCSARTKPFAVAGPLCLKGDIFTENANLPENLDRGDFVLLGLAGAYGFSRATWFGGHLPSVVSLNPEGPRIAYRAQRAVDLLLPSFSEPSKKPSCRSEGARE